MMVFFIQLSFFFLAPSSCNFDGSMCGFTQDKNDQFDWTRQRGSTTSGGTGPSGDHTGNGKILFCVALSYIIMLMIIVVFYNGVRIVVSSFELKV